MISLNTNDGKGGRVLRESGITSYSWRMTRHCQKCPNMSFTFLGGGGRGDGGVLKLMYIHLDTYWWWDLPYHGISFLAVDSRLTWSELFGAAWGAGWGVGGQGRRVQRRGEDHMWSNTRKKATQCYRGGLYGSLTCGVRLTVHYSAVDIFLFPSLLYSVQNYFAINIEPFSKDKLVCVCCFRWFVHTPWWIVTLYGDL